MNSTPTITPDENVDDDKSKEEVEAIGKKYNQYGIKLLSYVSSVNPK